MASVVSSAENAERAATGETVLELIAVRYTGDKTLFPTEGHLTPAGYPSSAPLDGGPTADANGAWNFVLMPDDGLSRLEGRPDLEVVYAADQQAQFAEVLLDAGLPGNVFGRGASRDLQDRTFDALGLKPTADGGRFEDQLRAIAGHEEAVEADTDPNADPAGEEDEQNLASEFAEKYTRNELGDICKALRADPSEFNLRENATKTERAEFIVTFGRQERAAAVEAALGGED